MGRSLLTRCRAAAMAVCFLCAGIIFPDLDAALFHGAPSQEESRPHVEATGSSSCHGESCVLGAVLPQSQQSGSSTPDLVKLFESSFPVPHPVFVVYDRAPSDSFHSRAPPAFFVS